MISKEVKKLQTKVLNRYIKLSTKYPILVDAWNDDVVNIVLNSRGNPNTGLVLNKPIHKSDFSKDGLIDSFDKDYYEDDLEWFNGQKDYIINLSYVFFNLGLKDTNAINYCAELLDTREYSNVLMALVTMNQLKFKR